MLPGKQGRKGWSDWLPMLFVSGVVCTFVLLEEPMRDMTTAKAIFGIALFFAGLYAFVFLQIMLHEAGHLLFGLLTGYRFISLQIGNFIWIKSNDKIRFCRLSVPYAISQCLMAPPERKDQKIPFVLYHLGGPILNLLSSGVFVGLYVWLRGVPHFPIPLFGAALISLFFALFNGVPLRKKRMNNDGYQVLLLHQDGGALRAFVFLMEINEQLVQGVRLKDQPSQWFAPPPVSRIQNSVEEALYGFTCRRLMDERHFEKAAQAMHQLTEREADIAALHRSIIGDDLIFCELAGESQPQQPTKLQSPPSTPLMHSTRRLPSALRTEYTRALLVEKNWVRAEQIKMQFETIAKRYPYPGIVEGEWDLIRYAYQKARQSNVPLP